MSATDFWKHKKNIMRLYDDTANHYNARYANEQNRKYQVVLEAITFDSDDIILDNGCGTGIFMAEIVNHVKMIVGVDISINMLKKACERMKGVKEAHVIYCDSDNLPLREGVFSKVVAFTLIQNVPDPNLTLSEIKRVSSSGATVVLTFLKRKFKLDEVEELLSKACLSVVEILDKETLRDYLAICRVFS